MKKSEQRKAWFEMCSQNYERVQEMKVQAGWNRLFIKFCFLVLAIVTILKVL